ncbi:hypothetical protein JM83_1889 [Gillisia sp. Hel_I_86]|nr:hypothetical protein JM83_1889 [Gillisia sp. Hel_I_86]
MNFNTLISALTNRTSVDKKLQPVPVKPVANEFSFKSKYQQIRISNRLFK